MPWKCSGCGTENPDDAIYCTTCGLKKPEESQPSQQTESVPQVQGEPLTTQQEQQPQTASPETPPVEQSVPTPQAEQMPAQPTQAEATPVQQPQTTQVQQPQPVGKYYIQFIATPVSSLNKTKVPLDFEVFETISLGRSPENVLMIPDNVDIEETSSPLSGGGQSIYRGSK